MPLLRLVLNNILKLHIQVRGSEIEMVKGNNPMIKHFAVWVLSILLIGLTACDQVKRIPEIPMGTGFAAAEICSRRFISNQDLDAIMEEVVNEKVYPLQYFWRVDVDEQDKTVSISAPFFKGINEATVVYREGLGCTATIGTTKEELRSQAFSPLEPTAISDSTYWPEGKAGVDPHLPHLDYDRIHAALKSMFDENDKDNIHTNINTYAALVVYDNKLIAEEYAEGYSKETRFLGWSMTKTVTTMLLGILQGQGRVGLDDTLSSWKNTDKAVITLRNILHMSTGLEWNEGYKGQSSVSLMLYAKGNMAEYVKSLPLAGEPGKIYNYSTGDTQLLADYVTQKSGGTLQSVYNFYQQNLFHKLHVTSALIEHDVSGVFIGGARAFMTARDWARLGLLIYNKGKWHGEQIIPESWIDFMLTPSRAADFYGGQIWLSEKMTRSLGLPPDLFSFKGHLGQYIVVIPSAKLIVVRLGAFAGEVDHQIASLDFYKHVYKIMTALPNTGKPVNKTIL